MSNLDDVIAASRPVDESVYQATTGTVAVVMRRYFEADGREHVTSSFETQNLDEHQGMKTFKDVIRSFADKFPLCGDGAATKEKQVRVEIVHTPEQIQDMKVYDTDIPAELADKDWTIGARYWTCPQDDSAY